MTSIISVIESRFFCSKIYIYTDYFDISYTTELDIFMVSLNLYARFQAFFKGTSSPM